MANTNTSTKANTKVAAPVMTKRAAGARWAKLLTEVVEAYGDERSAKLALGRLLVEAETIGARAKGDAFDVDAAILAAIEAHYGSAPNAVELHYAKRFAIVVDLMGAHKIGTAAQRASISPGATRELPAKLTKQNPAKAIAALRFATKGGGKVTGARIKAGVEAQRSGKAKATKATKVAATKPAPKVTEYTPADVIAILTAAQGHKVTKETKVELQDAFDAYLARLT